MGSAFDDEDYILDLENASENTEVEVVGIDDVEYTIIGKLQGFYYLINMEDPDDFLIMKEDGEELVSISDENDFEKALWLYRTELKKVRGEE